MKKKSDSPIKNAKSPNEKRFHDLIQPIMRFKPRLDLERILEEVNKNNYGRADRSIIEKQLSKFDSNNLIVLNNSETENLDESMEHYLKYINSQNRIAIMKMIQDKTLDKIVKQFKKEEKDQKIINDNFESNKDGNTDRKKNYSNKIKKEKENQNAKQDKKMKSSKFNFVDKSCAKDILKELHIKTYFNATNIIASDSKLTNIKESIKILHNEERLNNKDFENKSNGFNFQNKGLKKFLVEKQTKSFQDQTSSNNSFNSKMKIPVQANLNVDNQEIKKRNFTAYTKNMKLNSGPTNKKDLTNTLPENTSDEKINNNDHLESNKKNFNKSENNFFRATKINRVTYQSKNNIVENVISKFKNTFSSEKDQGNQDFEENALLYNPNFNHLRKKQKKAEDCDNEKLDYLKKLAFAQNKKLTNKRFNNLARHHLERNVNQKKAEKEKEKEGNLNDSDEDLLEINNELKNSFKNHSSKNNKEKGNPNINISFSNEKSSKQKSNLRRNEKFFNSSNNLKGIYSPNGENVIKIDDLAKVVVDKCNFVMKKHKNNNIKLASGNGKLMITSGLSVNDFIKRFNFK